MKKRIQALIEEKDVERLSDRAKKEGHTLSSLVRHIVKVFLSEKSGKT